MSSTNGIIHPFEVIFNNILIYRAIPRVMRAVTTPAPRKGGDSFGRESGIWTLSAGRVTHDASIMGDSTIKASVDFISENHVTIIEGAPRD